MSDSNATELLPCPICGAIQPAVQVRWVGFTHTHNGAFDAGYRGECCDCGLITRAFDNEADAAEAWNTRTPEQAVAATLGADDGSRWFELFSTPERAAQTLEAMELDASSWCNDRDGNHRNCGMCPYEYDYYGCYHEDGFSMLEWLRGKAVS